MDKFNFVMPLDQLKTDSRHNHLDIFREFLDHLGRIPHNGSDKVARGERPVAVYSLCEAEHLRPVKTAYRKTSMENCPTCA